MELTFFSKDKFTITIEKGLTKLNTPKLKKYTILNDTFYGTKDIKVYYSFKKDQNKKAWKNYNDMNYYGVCNSKLYYINAITKTKNERNKLLKQWILEISRENQKIGYENKAVVQKLNNNGEVEKIKNQLKKENKKITKIGSLKDLPF